MEKSSILGRDIFIAGAAWLAPSYFGKLITQRRRHGNVQSELKNNTDSFPCFPFSQKICTHLLTTLNPICFIFADDKHEAVLNWSLKYE
jgi:hypothetical protein